MTQRLATTRGWGWLQHLRDGGTTPWREWRGEATAAARALPGAEQLELLRRLNALGPVDPALAERVLRTSAPGRGRRGLPLAGDGPPPAYGVAPVDPAELPPAELVRGATLLLAQDLIAGACDPEPRPGRRRLVRSRYRLAGDPWLTRPLREELLRRGRPEGGRGATVYVVGRSFDAVLAGVWTTRAFGDGVSGWDTWLDAARRQNAPGPRADLLAIARWWAARVGRERVEIVLDPAELPRLLGVRRRLPAPPRISADATELARLTGPALGLLVPSAQRRALLQRALLPRLPRLDPGGSPPRVPARHLDWVGAQALAQRDGLLADGYACHGDPDLLLARPSDAGATRRGAPAADRVLDLALRLLLDGPRPDRARRVSA